MLDSIEQFRGITHVVSQEEVEFYRYFVERDLPNDISEEEIALRTDEYIKYVNAIFYLANKWGISEPYSFELLELRMQQENQQRKIKIESGEVVYGLQQFTLETYFQYRLSNLETDLCQYLEQNIDKEILQLAKKYYKENKEKFRYRTKVTYELMVDNKSEIISVDASQLNLLGKTDGALADFLLLGEIGQSYEDVFNGKTRKVVLRGIIFNEDGFENSKEIIIYKYIREELLDMIIKRITVNNPIEYECN